MSLFHSLLASGTDTTELGEQLIGVIGDSNADGRGASIPTVGADTLRKFNGTTFDNITTQSVANEGGGIYGSIWQQFATDYKAASGKITLLVNGALGGSEFYPTTDNNNWYTSGDLYVPWRDNMKAALQLMKLSKPKAIFVNLGINDIRATTPIGDVTTGAQSLVARLKADFPLTDVVFIQVGRTETLINFQGRFDVAKLLVETCETESYCHMCGNGVIFAAVSGGYNVDNLHYSQATNNSIGSMLSRWMMNGAYTKWARSIMSTLSTDITSTRKGLINTFIQSMGSNFHSLNMLHNFKAPALQDIYFDWTFLGFGFNTSGSFSANTSFATDGTTAQYFASGYVNSFYNKGGAGQNNFMYGVKLITTGTVAGTAAVMTGRADASSNTIRIGQGSAASPTNFMANDNSAVNGTQADLVIDTLYTTARPDSANKEFYRNKTLDVTSATASTGALSGAIYLGLFVNSAGTLQFPYNGAYHYVFASAYSGFNYNTFYDAMEALIDGW